MVLVLRSSRHHGTGLLCAELCDGAIQHVDLIQELQQHVSLVHVLGFLLECSSSSGNMTARRRLPDPRVAAACFISSCPWLPSGMFFLGLNVLDDLLPNKKLILEQ